MKHIHDFQNHGRNWAGKRCGGQRKEGRGEPSRVIAVNGPVMRICIQEAISQDLCSLASSLALPSPRPGTELIFYGL